MQRALPPVLLFGLWSLAAFPCAAQGSIAPGGPRDPAPAEPPIIIIELTPAAEPPASPPQSPTPSLPLPPDEPTVASAEDVAERPFALGLSGLFGARDGIDGVVMTWTAGIDLAYRVAPWARIALRRVTFGYAESAQGGRFVIGASPALDLSVPLDDVVEPFAQLGVGAQVRLGARAPSYGLAPFVAAGVRFHVAEWLALGAEAAMTVVATEHVLVGHELFPRASILVQLGTSLEARF